MKTVIIWLALVSLMVIPHLSWAAYLESPSQDANLSGVGFISGWKCNATNITLTINDGEHLPVAMHQVRTDLIDTCGSAPHGFIKQVNWAWPHVSDGEHVVVAYDDGVEFGRATFRVGTLGEEFPTGLEKQIVVDDFPSPGEQTVLVWNESTQHFEVLYVTRGEPRNYYDIAFWSEWDPSRIGDPGFWFWSEELLYEEVPDVDNCQAGRLTEAAKNRALETTNQIRALSGLSPLKYSPIYDNQAQKAALIQEANPPLATHFPPPSHKCYTEEGRAGSETSNLSGSSDSNNNIFEPAVHIISLADDFFDPNLGHRRWILNPFGTYMSYGQVGGYAAQKLLEFPQEPVRTPQINVDFVAFPYGTYPYNLFYNNRFYPDSDPTPWSFSVIIDKKNLWGNKGDFFKNAIVTVTRASDNTQLPIFDRYTDTKEYGLPNIIAWQVEGWEYDTLYEVNIKNVTFQDGSTHDYSYTVFIKREGIIK